jgi:hypothetical protein
MMKRGEYMRRKAARASAVCYIPVGIIIPTWACLYFLGETCLKVEEE